MTTKKQFSLKARLNSVGYALEGLESLWRYEHNFRVHGVAALLVVIMGLVLKISSTEWLAVLLVMGMVIALEIVNTAIEYLADFISPEFHPVIKKIKDLSAAGVLVTAITAVAVGFLVFIPKIIHL